MRFWKKRNDYYFNHGITYFHARQLLEIFQVLLLKKNLHLFQFEEMLYAEMLYFSPEARTERDSGARFVGFLEKSESIIVPTSRESVNYCHPKKYGRKARFKVPTRGRTRRNRYARRLSWYGLCEATTGWQSGEFSIREWDYWIYPLTESTLFG